MWKEYQTIIYLVYLKICLESQNKNFLSLLIFYFSLSWTQEKVNVKKVKNLNSPLAQTTGFHKNARNYNAFIVNNSLKCQTQFIQNHIAPVE